MELVWRPGVEAMEDDYGEFEANTEAAAKVEFKNEIPDEPLVPPAKHVSRIRKLSSSFVALLLVLVAIINLAMIIWFLSR
jgi:hypothetical protein